MIKKEKLAEEGKKMVSWIAAKKMLLSSLLTSAMLDFYSLTAYADDGETTTGADAKWDTVIGFITPWITRLGGVVILIGAVEFGLGFKDDNADTKTRGMKTIIAGAIVFAVGGSSQIFLS